MAQDPTVTIGKLSFPKSDIIDRGNTSSVILKGLFEKKTPVTIKRVLKVRGTKVTEAEHLREHDRHENIVRFYTTEEDADF
jgi:hypothetical protein